MTGQGIRVRLLRKVERLDPERHAWAVEMGTTQNGRWQTTQIISRHESEMSAACEMSRLLREGEGVGTCR